MVAAPESAQTKDESVTRVSVRRVSETGNENREDAVAVEEPMEIRVGHGPTGQRTQKSVSVTMRTPGHDFELAGGFLFTEGIVAGRDTIDAIDFCGPPAPGASSSNIVRVDLRSDVIVDTTRLQRNFYATSSCGICGKASLDALNFDGYPVLKGDGVQVTHDVIHSLPGRLRGVQRVFEATGGLHASGLFSTDGDLLCVREDVGRHNAVDKLIGAQMLAGTTPLDSFVMVVSGRTSFEILQKGLAAQIPIIVAVGAPSSLAVEMAQRFNITLIGFARDGRFNVYSGEQRVVA